MRTDNGHILLSLLCLLMAAGPYSCTKPSLPDSEENVKVVFSSPRVPDTKAPVLDAEIGVTYNTKENFSVFAAKHKNPWQSSALTLPEYYMGSSGSTSRGVECAYLGNTWDPAAAPGGRAYYWELGDDYKYLTVQAYSPAAAKEDMNTEERIHTWEDGFTFKDFTVRDPGSQYDLLYSSRTFDQQASMFNNEEGDDDDNSKAKYAGIDIEFHHALSSINFKVGLKENYSSRGTKVVLTGLTLHGVKMTGTFHQALKDNNIRENSDEDGAYEAASRYWDDIRTVYENGLEAFKDGESSELRQVPSSEGFETSGNWRMSNNRLMLIPQPTEEISVSIRLNLIHVTSEDGLTMREIIKPLSGFDKWERGKKYTYYIRIGLDGADIIPFIVPWESKIIYLQ